MKKLFTLAFLCLFALNSFAQEPGEIDTSFGTDGTFLFHPSKVDKFKYFDKVYKVLVQEDGKILTIGESRTDGYNYSIYISRHNVDGSLDETYGEGGIVFLKVDPLIYRNCPFDAVLSKGMLYVAGFTFNGLNSAFVLCLDENGFENEEFGDKGWVVTEQDQGGIVYEAIDIDKKGRVLVAGYYNDEIIVTRYTAKGNLDMTFGKNGTAAIELDADPAAHSYAFDIKALDNGKIIICGDKRLGNADEGMFIWSHLIRLKSNGTLDDTFAENGVLYLFAGEYAEFALSLAVQPDGKYLVGGHDELLSSTPEMPRYEAFITRVNTNGTIDTTFGTNGFTRFEPFEGDGCINNSYSILAAPDGQIFGTVYSRNIGTEVYRAYVYNLDTNGQLNESFAGSGIVPLPKIYEGQGELDTYSMAFQGNDKLIVGGYIAYDDPDEPGPGDYTKIYLTRLNIKYTEEEVTEASVLVDANEITETTIKAVFTPDANTTEYHVGIYTEEVFSQAVLSELTDALKADGKAYTAEQELTFEGLLKGTEYVILVAAKNAADEWNAKETYVVTLGGDGVEEMYAAVNVHPNPATSTIFVETTLNTNAQVSIIDLTGRCVKEVEISNAVSAINIEDLERGVYFISVEQNGNRKVEKLVVK